MLYENDCKKLLSILLFILFLIHDGLTRSLHFLFGHGNLHYGCLVRSKENEREGKEGRELLAFFWKLD